MARNTLADQIEADVADVFLATDDFAEAVEYTPHEGAGRSITVVIEDVTEAELTEEGGERAIRRLSVFAAKSSTTGIDAPQLQDELLLDGDERPFVYGGEIIEEDMDAWTLLFWRHEDTGRGASQ